jgi:small GTP-binding protein
MEQSFVIKTIISGSSGTGKSSIVNSINGESFNINTSSTIGVDWCSIKKKKGNIIYNFHLFDTSGQEAFNSITKSYYRDAKIVILVYSLNDSDSLKKISLWETDFDNSNTQKNVMKIFVGNKSDLKNIDNSDLIKQLKERNIKHIEVSAKDNINIELLQNMFTEEYINKYLDHDQINNKCTININEPKSDCYVKLDDIKKNKIDTTSTCC